MPDVFARFVKHGGQQRLDAGEQVVAVTVSNPPGNLAGASLGGAMGMWRARAKAAGHHRGNALADRLPSATLYLVLSDKRLVAFSARGAFGKPGDPVCDYNRSEIRGVERTKRGVLWKASLSFSDGSTRVLEFMSTAHPEAFFDGLDRWMSQ